MKEQNKTTGKELNEMEIKNLPDAKFKTMVISMLKEPSEKLKNVKNNIGTIKKNQSEMKPTLTEMKTKLQRINSRVDEAENQTVT